MTEDRVLVVLLIAGMLLSCALVGVWYWLGSIAPAPWSGLCYIAAAFCAGLAALIGLRLGRLLA